LDIHEREFAADNHECDDSERDGGNSLFVSDHGDE
jgi:hypothetical protein